MDEKKYTTLNGTVVGEAELKERYGDKFDQYVSEGFLKISEGEVEEKAEEKVEEKPQEQTTTITEDIEYTTPNGRVVIESKLR